jgi:hypothetical protein
MVALYRSRTCCSLLLSSLILRGPVPAAGNDHSQSRSEEINTLTQDRVPELLSDQRDETEAIALIFELGNEAIPSLNDALRRGQQVERAARALAYLGGPEERKTLLRAIRAEKNVETKWVMSSFLAGALAEPASQEEWNFLQTCVNGDKDRKANRLTALAAILALGTNASPKALQLLQTVSHIDHYRIQDDELAKEIAKAIYWIRQKPPSQSVISGDAQSDSEQIKRIVLQSAFYAKGEEEHVSVEETVFAKDKSQALATVEIYHGPRNARGYDILLTKSSETWRIVGVWFSWVA